MILKKTFILAAFIAVLLPSPGFPASPKHKVLFEKAKFTMETKGDLKGAVKLFNEIIEKYPDEREYAAKSQLYIGLCYEKSGLKQAQKAYRKVIDNYPGQQEEVAVAKERLARLTRALEEVSHKPIFREIRIPTRPGNGVLSSDGKKLAFTSKGSIWVVPVHGKVSPDIAGEPVRLTESMGAWNMGSTLSWSADGKWIAFNAKYKKKDAIYVIPSSGGKPKKIPVNLYRGVHPYNYRLSLSPDGKIVAFASEEKEKRQLFTVYVEGGDVNQLTEDGGTQPAFSPDGRKITYVKEKSQKTEITKSDVWVIPAAGGTPVQVSDLPGRAIAPIWSPDGKMIAFTRRRVEGYDSSKEIFIVPVSETGNPEESPTQIELPIETLNFLAGWTPDNKIGVLLTNPEHLAIYTVPASGGNATQVSPQGEIFHPRWSPDGERIYFRGNGIASVPSGGGEISIGPLDGEDSKVGVALPGAGNAVSPDGGKIVFSGYKTFFRDNKRDDEVDIYTIPVEGGEPKKLTISPGQDRFPCWSPDGKSIAFVRYPEPTKDKKKYIMNICIVRKEGGEVRQLTSESDKVAYSNIAWSPDGKSMAYFSSEDKTIRVIPVKGGESREVVKVEDVSSHSELDWLRDGKKLAYSSKGSIWVVSLDGGEPEEIKTGLDAKVAHISLSPNGGKIAFTAFKGGDTELCLMENFLPLLKQAEAVIRKEDKEFNIRQVWAGLDVRIGNMSSPSPDGRYISYTDRNGGDLALLELAAKKKHRFTNNWSFIESLETRTLTEEETMSLVSSFMYAAGSAWSPDGKQIAYGWCSLKGGSEIRLIGIDGSEPRVLSRNDDFEFTVPFDWSPDGKQIIAFIGKSDLTGQAVLVSVADGSVRILKNYDRPYMQVQAKVLFSPDGRYIVYDFVQKEGFTEHDIFLLSTDGDREIKLVEHPADDFVLGWAPDGKRLLFASDRTGEISVWIIQVANGKPQGDAELIKKDIGQIYPLGFTREGSFYYGLQSGMEDVYTATLDLEKSKLLTSPEKANQRLVGSTFFPDWSPDGKYLAYKSGEKLYIQSLETGMVRELTPDLKSFGPLRWSPDSHSILTPGVDYKGCNGLFEIDTKTGDITSIVQLVPEAKVRWATWSPDEKKLFYLDNPSTGDMATRIVMYDPVTKQEKELNREDSSFMALSPDGRSLAFLKQDQQTLSSSRSLNIMPAAGGELREVLKFKKEEVITTVAWTTDGSRLLFAKEISNGKKCELWQISIEGGKPQKLGLAMEKLNFLSVHPDGRRIAFCSSHNSAEIWVMENFLPE